MNLDGLGSSQCREDKGLGRIQRIEPCSRFQLLVDSNRPGPTGLLTRLGDKSVQTIQTSLPTLIMRFAQSARNQEYVRVRWFFPSAHGTTSTRTPHV